MKYTYKPQNKLIRAASSPRGGLMVAGGVYEVDTAHAQALVARIPGDGGPCLVPVQAEAAPVVAETPPVVKPDAGKPAKSAPAKPGPGETET